ncbi:MAG: type VI secretion protein IcmF/TssM N-terminal domain-containing protein [Desulfococcaceae bacterium]
MRRLILKIFKIFLLGLLALLGILLVFGAVVYLRWPWWVGFFVLLGLLGLWVGWLFIRKLLRRNQEQQFVDQIIDQDEDFLQTMAGKDRDNLQELQDRWKEAITALRNSQLKKQGNPLFVLPWYLIVGESGAGKSTAISSARLSAVFGEIAQAPGLSGTRNCDWWFFEDAILIDTAGRFAVPVDEERDREEWQRFLGLLAKYRKREPLNGLVVTVSADKLRQDDAPEEMKRQGKIIRARIDELMRVLGAKFPVYVLVTKLDRIQGMVQFCDALPDDSLEQAFGRINLAPDKGAESFFNRAMAAIGDRLRELRLLLIGRPGVQTAEAELLLFPEEFERLTPGLKSFVATAFKQTQYLETPLLRGIFFSSGRQEGAPFSHFLRNLGLIGEGEVLPDTNRGLFLKDFFARILPADRRLFGLTERAIQWNRLTRNLGLTSWVALGLALCGLLSYSFVLNLKALRDVPPPPSLEAATRMGPEELRTMEEFRVGILGVEAHNRRWFIPRFGLNQSMEIEDRLKAHFSRLFRSRFLERFDRELALGLDRFSPGASAEEMGRHVRFLVRRIHLVDGRIDGDEPDELAQLPEAPFSAVSRTAGARLEPSLDVPLNSLYRYDLLWGGAERESLRPELARLREELRTLLTRRRPDLGWVAEWVETRGDLKPITLADFWGEPGLDGPPIGVRPAYTLPGREAVRAFLEEIDGALPGEAAGEYAAARAAFLERYDRDYLAGWNEFVVAFPSGRERLGEERTPHARIAGEIGGSDGPYFAFLGTLAEQIEPVRDREDAPPWVAHLYAFQRAGRNLAEAEGGGSAAGATAATGFFRRAFGRGASLFERGQTAAERGQDAAERVRERIGSEEETRLDAEKDLKPYLEGLAVIAEASASRREAFRMAGEVFADDPVTSASPFYAVAGAVDRMAASTGNPESAFWPILRGPREFLWNFFRNEAACQLQREWESGALFEFRRNPEPAVVDAFLQGSAGPFVSRRAGGGYFPREAFGDKLDFAGGFFSGVNALAVEQAQRRRARDQKDLYRVNVQGSGADVNPGAQVRPRATILRLRCDDGDQALENLNFPVDRTFVWRPETCSEVSIAIEVGTREMTYRFGGELPFRSFVRTFRDGVRRFTTGDFPGHAAALERMGITHINVFYKLSGEVSGAAGHETGPTPGQAPERITRCWGG